LVAFEQIKAKLQKEGLFDEALKRRLPPFPRRIGVVTSPSGAALHDILTVLERRARSVSVVLIPTQVQGETARAQIARSISRANLFCDRCAEADRIDVLIVGRGGGSAEDLWAFNEEVVARAIRTSAIPVPPRLAMRSILRSQILSPTVRHPIRGSGDRGAGRSRDQRPNRSTIHATDEFDELSSPLRA
jgi:hypothetical protein